jgi:hypothetical protein
VEAFPYQKRESADVIYVGVTQYHPIDAAGIEGQCSIQGMGLRPAALKEARIEQDAGSSGLEQMHRAGHLACGTPECETKTGHGRAPPRKA